MSKLKKLHQENYPRNGVSAMVQKAINVSVACRRDRVEMEQKGLKWSDVEQLVGISNACSLAEINWKLANEECVAGTALLNTYGKECCRLRNAIAARINEIQKKCPVVIPVPAYKKSWSRPDIVQDLHTIHVLCCTYETALQGAGFELELGKQALRESQKLSNMIISTILQREAKAALLQQRNVQYHQLNSLLKDICKLGRSVFANDPRRKDYYCGNPRSRNAAITP